MENKLLAKLPGAELEHLRPHFERVSLHHGQHVIVPDESISDCYFPINCLLSLVTQMEDGSTVESGTIGREGMSGAPVLLDAATTPMPTFVQVPGEAIRINARLVKGAYEQRGQLHKLLNRYMHTVMVTGSQAVACNAIHRLEERLCKWLLMSADGIGSDEVDLTHEFLAMMLGVRRAGVTEGAIKLQNSGLIAYSRGHVRILDRPGLEASACECYRKTQAEYERLFSN